MLCVLFTLGSQLIRCEAWRLIYRADTELCVHTLPRVFPETTTLALSSLHLSSKYLFIATSVAEQQTFTKQQERHIRPTGKWTPIIASSRSVTASASQRLNISTDLVTCQILHKQGTDNRLYIHRNILEFKCELIPMQLSRFSFFLLPLSTPHLRYFHVFCRNVPKYLLDIVPHWYNVVYIR